ncbi:hypothetical protein PI124_g1675 [Phytophthora idaei]|nr:hypothetical protein PI125_g1543 [Phytophthora idaei]KAG3173043.1 hypothetical protein PI126_g1060 [Phytophthora idaei]KAG3253763.1 hypothetical protein PI124_g1675 [Phytophthora idaei]
MNDSEPELQVPPDTWTPPPIDVEWHETWEDVSAYIAQYQEQTNQVFGSAHRRRSLSVTERYWSARHAELGELYKVDKPREETMMRPNRLMVAKKELID